MRSHRRPQRISRGFVVVALTAGLLTAGSATAAANTTAPATAAPADAAANVVDAGAGTHVTGRSGPGEHRADRSALGRVLAAQFAASPDIPGIAARVDAPGLHWSGALGSSDRATGAPLRADHTFRLASVTKTFTAAAVLKLADQRRLRLDAPIDEHLPRPYPELLRRGGYRPDLITVRQLLSHTAGLADYATEDAYVETVLSDPQRRWTPAEQVKWAMDHGKPEGRPGERFYYSDTGYVLLARIVESVTRSPQAAAYRRLLRYDRLGLTATWFETLEPTPRSAGPRAHQYLIGADAGIDVDMHSADPSFDLYGGGGLVSSVADLNRFYRALLEGRVISRSALRTMLTTTPSGDDGLGPAGMGIFAQQIAGTTCWWHGGFWGSAALYCPDHRLAVSVTINTYTDRDETPTAWANAFALAATSIGLIDKGSSR